MFSFSICPLPLALPPAALTAERSSLLPLLLLLSAAAAAAAAPFFLMSDKIAQAEALKVEGNGFFAKKMYEQAIEKYAAAIALDPQNHIYYSNRSICYAESGQFEAAEKDGDMCVKLNAGFAKGYHRLANAQYLLEKYDEAMATVTEGLKKDGGFAELKKLKNKIKAKKAQKARALAGPSGGGGGGGVDKATQDEMMKLSEQYQTTKRDLMEVEARSSAAMKNSRRTALTVEQIEAVSDETPLFRGVGKMFLRAPKADIKGMLDEQVAEENEKMAALDSKKNFLNRRLQSQERDLQDLMKTLVAAQG